MPVGPALQWLLQKPLYELEEFEGLETWAVLDVIYINGTYDSYCPTCARDATFSIVDAPRPPQHARPGRPPISGRAVRLTPDPVPSLASEIYRVSARCTRAQHHTQDFFFQVGLHICTSDEGKRRTTSTFQKIGQQPSYGDLHLASIKKYRAVLSKEKMAELTRAIGLASHDVGIGAYVYLRRIFESLIDEAHENASTDQGWDEGIYQKSRMADRIAMLEGHLPEFLNRNPAMYSLLSEGVHELSEQDCLKHFDTLRIGIELILDEKLESAERKKKIKDAEIALKKAVT